MKLSERTKAFINTYIDLIDDENYQLLYEHAARNLDSQPGLVGDRCRVSELTYVLSTIGINPLNYLDYVPALYMRGSSSNFSIVLPDHIKEIRNCAFALNTNITHIKLPSNLHKIEEAAFASCYNLEKVAIPKSIRVIEKNAFAECCKLQDIIYEGTMSEWDNVKQRRSSWGHDDTRKSPLRVPAETISCVDGTRPLTRQRAIKVI